MTTLLELDPSAPCEPLGSVEDVAAWVRGVEPEAELSDPSHGWIRCATWSIEPAIGREDPVEWIRLFVRGSGDHIVGRILHLAGALGCVVFDDGELESVWDAEDVSLWHAYQRACKQEDASHAAGATADRIAFVVVNDARPACFVLINWWATNGLDMHQRYFTARCRRTGRVRC